MYRIDVYGDIDPHLGVSAESISRELKDADGAPVELHVQSGGGDVFEGIAIMNSLRDYAGEVVAVVEGVAASAASFIVVGGADRVVMQETASLMIHEAWSMVAGSSGDLTKTAAELDRMSGIIAKIYADKAGTPVEEWREAMREESWFSAEEAVLVGLADEVKSVALTTVENKVPKSRVLNSGSVRWGSREQAPTSKIVEARRRGPTPSPTSKEESTMDIFSQIAQAMGTDKESVRNALAKVMNAEIEITSVVEITYPEDTTVVPTGKVTITPQGEIPAGIVFSVGEAPEGWAAEVDEATGVLTVNAPSGVEPGSEATFVVTAQGNGEPVEFPVTVGVKSAAEDEGTEQAPTEQAPTEADPTGDTITLDRDTYNDLTNAAKLGWQAKNKADATSREVEVDKWIKEGRVNAARRSQIVAAMHKNPDAARDLYGAIPKNTIPRGEVGHGHAAAEESEVPSVADLLNLSQSRMSGKK